MSKQKKIEEEEMKCSCQEGGSCECGEDCTCGEEEHSCCSGCSCEENTEDSAKEVERLMNEVLLAKAELQNYRKRKDEETVNYLKFANQDLILELLPIVDNFERAIKLDDNNLSDELSKFLTGFKMMYTHLVETLKKFGVEEIPALGQEFDPSCMEAIMTGEDDTKANNEVVDVFIKGYRLKDRIIRAASVKVNQIEK